jgi:hypothetical protein
VPSRAPNNRLQATANSERSDDNPRRYLVSVFRPSKVDVLKAQLSDWERDES